MSQLQNKPFDFHHLDTDDCAWMENIHAECFDAPQQWKADAFNALIQQPLNKAIAIKANNARAGFIIARNVAGEGEILTLAIHPNHRRRGYATQLVNAFIEHEIARGLTSLFLEVIVTNIPAIKLYTAIGFAIISTRVGYYQMPEGHPQKYMDGLVMKKNIRP